MNNDPTHSQDDKWTMPEPSNVTPPSFTTQPTPQPVDRVDNEPSSSEPSFHSSFGSSLIAPQAPSNTAPSPQPKKPTRHIYGHQKRRTGIGMRLTVAFFGLLLIGGVGYLSMTLLNTGQERIASTLEVAWGNPIYEGNGSDIVEVIKPTSAFVCPDDYSQKGSGKTATCTKTETKTVSPEIYSCPSGYDKSGEGSSVKCSKIVGGTEVSVAASSAYTCAAGYSKSGSGSSIRCVKTETTGLVKSYSCVSGYLKTGEGEAIRCVKSSSVPGTVRGSCPSGYSASGSGVSTTCIQVISASSSTSYTCPGGYGARGSTQCQSNSSATPVNSYSCPSGYTQQSTIFCIKYMSGSCKPGYAKRGSAGSSYCGKLTTRPPGGCYGSGIYSYNSSYCISAYDSGTTGTYPPGACGYGDSRTGGTLFVTCKRNAYNTWSCPGGTTSIGGSGSGLICKTIINASSSTSYSCPSGYSRSGTSCSRSAAATLSCDSGYAKALTGPSTTCIKISMDTQPAIVTNICPSGFSESGSRCAKTSIVSGGTSYTCTPGYKLSGSRCTKIIGGEVETTQSNKSFGCPAGYDKSGEGTSMKCTKVVTDIRTIQAELVCQDGWFKREVGKSVDCARTASGKKPVDTTSKQ